MTRSLPASLAAAAVVDAACGSHRRSGPSAVTPATSAAVTSAATTASVPAELQFIAKTIDGTDFSGASLLGKPAVLWFWAPWCPTCQREAPMVGQIADAHPAVQFVGVAALDQPPAIQLFVAKYPVKAFIHPADTHRAIWAKCGVAHQPAYALVGANGSIDVYRGSLSGPEMTVRTAALSTQ